MIGRILCLISARFEQYTRVLLVIHTVGGKYKLSRIEYVLEKVKSFHNQPEALVAFHSRGDPRIRPYRGLSP